MNNWHEHVSEGWQPIIKEWYAFVKDEPIEILQIKEKFGGLRIYYTRLLTDYNYDKVDQVTHEAIMTAKETCAVCGDKGALRHDLPWVLTLCDKHYNERNIS